jgi:hypothetical protein
VNIEIGIVTVRALCPVLAVCCAKFSAQKRNKIKESDQKEKTADKKAEKILFFFINQPAEKSNPRRPFDNNKFFATMKFLMRDV